MQGYVRERCYRKHEKTRGDDRDRCRALKCFHACVLADHCSEKSVVFTRIFK